MNTSIVNFINHVKTELTNHLRKERNSKKGRSRGFYASEGKRLSNLRDMNTFVCSRKTYFDFVCPEKKQPFTDRALEVFRRGIRVEEDLINRLKKLKFVFFEYRKGYYIQRYMYDPEINCGGFVDATLKTESINGNGKLRIPVEIKSVEHFTFKRINEEARNITNKMQINFYQKMMEDKYGLLLYYNANTSHMKFILNKYSEELYKEMGEYFAYIQKYLDKGDAPPRDYDPLLDIQCSYCQYFKHCYTVDSPPPPDIKMQSQMKPKREITDEEKEKIMKILDNIGDLKNHLYEINKEYEAKKEILRDFLISTGLKEISTPDVKALISQRSFTKYNNNKLEQILKSQDLFDLRTMSFDSKKIKRIIERDEQIARVLEPAKEITFKEYLLIKNNHN